MNANSRFRQCVCQGFFVLCGLLLSMDGGAASISKTPSEDWWVPNGEVKAIACTSTTVYIGGDFTHVAQPTGDGAILDVATGKVQKNNFKVRGYAQDISDVISDDQGGWYLSGHFDANNERHLVLHLFPDGSIDPRWNPPHMSGWIDPLVKHGSNLYAGGRFTMENESVFHPLVVLDAITGKMKARYPQSISKHMPDSAPLAPDVDPAPAGNEHDEFSIRTLTATDATLYIGGDFAMVNGKHRPHLAALDIATGKVSDWNPQMKLDKDTCINVLQVADSKLYVGGFFHEIGGKKRESLAALDLITGKATDWNPAPNEAVYSLALSSSTLYIGGAFGKVFDQERRALVAFDRKTGELTPWDPKVGLGWASDWDDGYEGPRLPNQEWGVRTIALHDSRVYIGGQIWSVGGKKRSYLACVDMTTGTPTDWNPHADSPVGSLQIFGSTMHASGGFTSMGGEDRCHVAALDMKTGVLTLWNPKLEGEKNVTAMAIVDSTIYLKRVPDRFHTESGSDVMAVDIATGEVKPTQVTPNDAMFFKKQLPPNVPIRSGEIGLIAREICASATWGNVLFVAGEFSHVGNDKNQESSALVAIDMKKSKVIPWRTGVDVGATGAPGVNALAATDNALYVGGFFCAIGGEERHYFARFDIKENMPEGKGVPLPDK